MPDLGDPAGDHHGATRRASIGQECACRPGRGTITQREQRNEAAEFPIAEYLLACRRVFVRLGLHGTASYGRQLASRFPARLPTLLASVHHRTLPFMVCADPCRVARW